jgi:hypothetical protein
MNSFPNQNAPKPDKLSRVIQVLVQGNQTYKNTSFNPLRDNSAFKDMLFSVCLYAMLDKCGAKNINNYDIFKFCSFKPPYLRKA